MKAIFLDIDGVLKEEDYDAEFKDECFVRLKRIVDATNAEIILSSSWRINYWNFVENNFQTDKKEILDLYNHFEKYGMKVSGRTDYTERSGPESRPFEIRRWLASNENVETFCIIDDDDFYCWKWLSQFLVITRIKTLDDERYNSWKRTLSDADVDRAIEILNKDNKSFIQKQF
ncbi:MAG: HAD domain-containing protein [Clostridium sp.]|nr:HAD domain-containing protein [Clostridium sp.]